MLETFKQYAEQFPRGTRIQLINLTTNTAEWVAAPFLCPEVLEANEHGLLVALVVGVVIFWSWPSYPYYFVPIREEKR